LTETSASAALSTYRVQLHAGFAFDDVARISLYLAQLGVTHVYCSPYLQAHPGSTHGYDVEDHSRFNEEIGGAGGFERMTQALEANGLRHIADIVPNHVSIAGRGNSRWWDVLKHGPASRYASYFDIEWRAGPQDLLGKVLAPILGNELDTVIDNGQIELVDGDEPCMRYFDNELPLAPGSFTQPLGDNDIREVLGKQHYLVAHWRRAARHLNYRRFFDINTLAGLQMDTAGVFEETHELVLGLVRDGKLDGLRIDHIDGLRDPAGYLTRLREASGGVHTVVEKILEPGEELPPEWPVAGTTGYDFLNLVQGLFVDPAGEVPLTELYTRFTGEPADLAAVAYAKKMLIMRQIMVSDLNRLVWELDDVAEQDGWELDPDTARIAIAETIAAFGVYRTYIIPQGHKSDQDIRLIGDAIEAAKRSAPHIEVALFERLHRVLLLEEGGDAGRAFVLRFQQTTGPIMAKGVEDTVFYNYNRLTSLNEVGGSPGHFGVSIEAFHEAAAAAQEQWPRSMLATSTHDTKRGEDVRARINLLSEIPDTWAEAAARWSKIGERHRTSDMPDRNAEYLFYQALVGAWPLDTERAVAYMQKASKEAKRHTSWLDPDPDYDRALEAFVRGVLADEEHAAEVAAFVAPLVEPGRVNSLAQTLIKLTYPGVPDTYQGTELWDLSLVDPDNRRPVDYEMRAAVLGRSAAAGGAELWAGPDDGAPKMLVTARTLQLRRALPEAFDADASYEPLEVQGDKAGHLVAFCRAGCVAVLASRLVVGLGGEWGDTTVSLPGGSWHNVFTGNRYPAGDLRMSEVLAGFPVALLRAE
jgi:(1->4)-alpha-D-glucan 1-alpha-D-glucosylmutase